MTVDLHAHTTCSDGSLSPRELVQLAAQVGLSAVAITDHDTIAGWEEALLAGVELGIEVVPGVELSTSYPGGRFDMLGYYIERDSELIEVLQRIQKARSDRNTLMFERLRKLGVPLAEAEVRVFAGQAGLLGRPHFAQAMVQKGYVKTTQEAFDRYLSDRGPAYVAKQVLEPREAISLIHDAGGVAIWAHPLLHRKYVLPELESRLREFAAWGLDGLEVWYPRFTSDETAWALNMSEQLNLLPSGGSDFHGRTKPDIQLGGVTSGRALPDDVLNGIQARRDEIRAAAE